MSRMDVVPVAQSGAYVKADIEVEISSGLFVQVSGQHIYVESGPVVGISGQAVLPSYCVDGQGMVHNTRLLTDCSGILYTWISGQHVYVESGPHVQRGQGPEIDDDSIVRSGIRGTDIALLYAFNTSSLTWERVEFDGISRRIKVAAIISGTVLVSSGAVVVDSGLHVIVESGLGVQVESGAYIASGVQVGVSGQAITIGGALIQVPVDIQAIYKTHTDEWSGFLGSGDVVYVSGADVSTYQKLGLYVQASGSMVINIQASWDDTSGNYCDYDGYDPLISGFQGCKRYSLGHYPFEYVRAKVENMGASGRLQIRWARAT